MVCLKCTENSGSNEERGVHAIPAIIFSLHKWRSLDCVCLSYRRLFYWSELESSPRHHLIDSMIAVFINEC